MARVGISKTYAAGALTDVTALFGLIKQMIVDAGFNVITNTSTRIEFMPAGTTPAANSDDDTPHWTIHQIGTTQIVANALKGLAWDDANVKTGAQQALVQAPVQYNDGASNIDSPLVLRAAADGREGWFWMASTQLAWDAVEEVEVLTWHKVVAGTRSRRLSADNSSGTAARYGLFTHAGVFAPAYAINSGNASVAAALGWWSPVCADGNGSLKLAATIGAVAAPIYPRQVSGMATALYGELEDVLATTDSYAHLSTTALPGWITFTLDVPAAADLAFRAPASFTPV